MMMIIMLSRLIVIYVYFAIFAV